MADAELIKLIMKIKPGRLFEVTGEMGLYDLTNYPVSKSVKYQWPHNTWEDDQALWLPPKTSASEKLGTLEIGSYIRIDEWLFYSEKAKNNSKLYQCLKVSTYINDEIKTGFAWTIYKGVAKIKPVKIDFEKKADVPITDLLGLKKY